MPVGPNSAASTSNNALTRLKLVAMTTVSALALAALALVVLFFVSAKRSENDAKRSERETERVSALTVDCAGGDNGACDDLFQTGTNVDYACTCGGARRQADRRRDLRGASNKGRAEARASCTDGNFADCDELYYSSEVDSEAEAFGASCGGRTDGAGRRSRARRRMAARNRYPSRSATTRTLDGLWTRCEAGDGGACDQLFAESPSGSDYENFGLTCGNRTDGSQDSCVGAF